MSDYFTGQIVMTGFGFAPRYFATCDGQQLSINQNQALFALLGVTYGGNGQTSFNLPDLRGRTPAGGGSSSQTSGYAPTPYALGQAGGAETVALTADQNPAHTHGFGATTATGVNQYCDGNVVLAKVSSPALLYGTAGSVVTLGGGPTTAAGGGQAHENMQPFAVINFTICLSGLYPTRA